MMLRKIVLSLTAISLAGCAFHHTQRALTDDAVANRDAANPARTTRESRFAWVGRMSNHLVPHFHAHTKNESSIPASVAVANSHRSEVRIDIQPFPVPLGDTRRLNIALQYINTANRFQEIPFPTGQRFDIILRDDSGKVITQWSEDQVLDKTPGSIFLNPGEAAEYDATIATREMSAGRSYTIEAWFTCDPEVIARKTFVPHP